MASLETLLRTGYLLVIITILMMIWVSLSGASTLDAPRYQPCYFNRLCSCTKSIPDLGNVKCLDIPLPRIPPPLNNSKLFTLHLDNNGLRSIEPYFFQSTALWGLYITNNPIYEIPDAAFIGLERTLWKLELKNDFLIRIPSRALRHLQKLQSLDLSDNDIMEIEADSWRGLGGSLQHLTLANNAISNLPLDAFGGLPLLETIDLRGNNLKEIDSNAFRDGMGHLHQVLLSDNLLTVIPYVAVSPLKQLKLLDLKLNRIATMEAEENVNATTPKLSVRLSLDEIRLDYNQITYLPTQSFIYFGLLNKTYLDGNPLQFIDDDAFRPSKIRELSLHNCRLSSITPAAFGGLESSLQVLDLSGNNLTALPNYMFNSFDYLHTLSLRENKIEGLKPGETFNGFEYSLNKLDLSGKRNSPFAIQSFKQLRGLRSLSMAKLSKSQLDPEDFLDFGIDLDELSILGGNLKTIKDHAFRHVRGIKKLDLSENKIEKIENDAFLEIGHTLTNLRISHGLATQMNTLSAGIFRHLSEIIHLDLSNNKLVTIPDTSFHFMRKVKIIELHDNEITDISKGTFQGDIHSELVVLYLSFNSLKTIHQHTFVDLPRLEQILLDDNKIDHLERRAFMNMDNLKVLNMKGNKISTISDEAFQNLPALEYLDMAYNALKSFDFTMFDQVGTLSHLKVNASHNKIRDLFIDGSSFSRETGTGGFHSNIMMLDLSYNNISHISRSFFRPVETSLTHLHLSHNNLLNATWDVFGNMPHLQWLDLSKNRLGEIMPDAFRNTRTLQVFLASHNRLESLHGDIFRAMYNLRIADLSNNYLRFLPDGLFFGEGLEKLDLSHNELTRLPLNGMSFGSASTLCDFDVSHNEISIIPNGEMFSRFKSLRTLDLSYNNLMHLNEAVFASLTNLITLDLSHNIELLLEPDGRSFQGIDDSLWHLKLDNVSLYSVCPLPFQNLRSLSLAYNMFPTVPQELALNMSKLRQINLAHNDLTHVPLMLNSLLQLRDVSLAFNPITSLTNQSLAGVGDRLRELDIRGLPLTEFEVDSLIDMTALRTLKLSHSKNSEFNVPDLIEHNIAIRNLELLVESETSLAKEMAGPFPTKLRNISITGHGIHVLSNNVFQGLTSPFLHLDFTNSSVTVLSSMFFKNLGAVRNISVDVSGNAFKTLENPSTTYAPGVQEETFLTDIVLRNNLWACNCDIGWVEIWLRKRRQYLCADATTDFILQDKCRLAHDDLREAKCANKGNSSLLEVLKTDIECEWSHGNSIQHNYIFLLVVSAINIVLNL